jgi:HAD superfamily hydrolase (TIGR01509 family)
MALEALIFDVDGTLANTERDGHLLAFNLAFEQSGLDWQWSNALYHQLLDVTGGQLRIKHYVRQYLPNFKTANLDAFALALHQLKTKIYVQIVNEGKMPLRPGVVRLFNEAREAGLRLAIATTTTPANVDALIINTLGRHALDWFEVIGAGDVVSNLKPAGDIYDYVLAKMQLKASQCLAFEDSQNGIVSATKANLKTIITVNEYTQTHDFSQAIVILDNLGEPHQPFKMIKGEAANATHVDVAYLQELYAQHC